MNKNPNYFRAHVGGQERGFKLGIAFIGELLEKNNLAITDLSEAMSKNPFKVIPEMVLFSHQLNERIAKREVNIDYYDVVDWIEEEGGIMGEFVKNFIDAWQVSMGTTGDPEKEKKALEEVAMVAVEENDGDGDPKEEKK